MMHARVHFQRANARRHFAQTSSDAHCLTYNFTGQVPADYWGGVANRTRCRRWREGLAWAGLGVGVVRGPHRRNEQLHGAHFAGDRIEDIDGVAGEIDEHLLPADVGLAHARPRRCFQASKVVLS